ncbi:hypothetical protein EBI_26669 [Enterocytozoon bieneusi H348]|nr:hypothetical protein EBI_26669 [Enterocytozoon bieneusi H348]|eukprot:XP_002650879.1 hypothetical protein EBI_26669 [Enterocytozoon bieneusi H348]
MRKKKPKISKKKLPREKNSLFPGEFFIITKHRGGVGT